MLDFGVISSMPFQLGEYLVKEAFMVLLVIATVLAPLFLCTIAFVLLWQGVLSGFQWLKARALSLIGSVRDPLPHREALSHPHSRR